MKKIIILSLITLITATKINAMEFGSEPNEYFYYAGPEDIMSKEKAEAWFEKNTGKKVKIIYSKDRLGLNSGGQDLIEIDGPAKSGK